MKAFLSRLCSISRLSSRAATSRRRRSGSRAPRGSARRSTSQSSANGVDVVDPAPAEPRRRARRRPRSCAAREPPGSPSTGAVLEPVLADAGQRHELELPLDGPPGLAEQVAHHGRQQRDVGPASHANPSAARPCERAAERCRSARAGSPRGRAWPAGPPRRGRRSPPPTTTTRAIGLGTLRGDGSGADVGRGLDQRPEPGVVLLVEEGHQRHVDLRQPVPGHA